MGKFYYDAKGYPRWRDSNLLVHRTVSKPKGEEVTHHIDGNTKNFRKSNLINMSRSAHSSLHVNQRKNK
ncbi:MAG: HNH endonuclease [Candidatus Nanoarchaeia archaeon]|nr:HNH endonuclease [Candidatus Nanoarchaeia archaeon]